MFQDDISLARFLATGAGKVILNLKKTHTATHNLGTKADKASQNWIAMQLKKYRPNDAVLSEEAEDDLTRINAKRVWIIDPLDGSYQFEIGSKNYAVHIALLTEHKKIGVVFLPEFNKIYDTQTTVTHKNNQTNIIVTSSSRLNPLAEIISDKLGYRIQRLGSAGVKAMHIVNGQADAYIHAGNLHEWDSCAPVLIAKTAGLNCSDFNGMELTFNKINPLTHQLLICLPDLTQELITTINDSF